MTRKYDDMTVGELRELRDMVSDKKPEVPAFPFKIGDKIFVRTVTHHQTGRLASVGRDWFRLDDAAWIADNGRFADFLKTGKGNEVEPCPSFCIVGRGAVIDMFPWPHDLPREQK